jgi:hypothetical protein
MYADIFITAVMTGTPRQNGMSVLLVHKDTPGFSVRKENIRGADLSGSALRRPCIVCAFVTFAAKICRYGVFGFSQCASAVGSFNWS